MPIFQALIEHPEAHPGPPPVACYCALFDLVRWWAYDRAERDADAEIKHRFTVLTWAVGVTAALTTATLGVVISMSYQLGQIAGELTILAGHVQLR